jgi:hypothetical protein
MEGTLRKDSAHPQRRPGHMSIRPKGSIGPDQSLFHNPQRDLAYAGPQYFASAINLLLDAERREGWMTEYLRHHKITDSELGEALQSFRRYFNEVKDPANKIIDEAMAKSGVMELREPVRFIVWVRLGQVLTGMMFPYIRQTVGIDKPNVFAQLDGVFAQAEEAVRRVLSTYPTEGTDGTFSGARHGAD